MKSKIPIMIIPFENEQLEYKLTVERKNLCREIVALANTKGGKIIIGITDDRTVVGAGKLTADDVANMVRGGCVPPLAPKIDREDYNGMEVIIVTVKPDGDVPYSTNHGVYYIRVGATVRIASVPELASLIIKGPYGPTMEFRARIPQLQNQISTSMLANAGFDQALTGITALSNLAMNADEVTKIETVLIVSKLLRISCSNDEVIRRLLILLAALTSRNLAQNPCATPPDRVLFEMIIDHIKERLFLTTSNSEVTDRTVYILHALHIVGVGCIWAEYDDLFKEVMRIVNLTGDTDRKLTELCRDTAARLEECAAEESTHPTRRLGMLKGPLVDQHDSPAGYSLFTAS